MDDQEKQNQNDVNTLEDEPSALANSIYPNDEDQLHANDLRNR